MKKKINQADLLSLQHTSLAFLSRTHSRKTLSKLPATLEMTAMSIFHESEVIG